MCESIWSSSLNARTKLTARCWAEISAPNLAHNLQQVRRCLRRPETRICAVVKANAYGHGAVLIAREAVAAGADFLAVATPGEAFELRQAGIEEPILILAESPIQECGRLVKMGIRQTIASFEEGLAFQERAFALGLRLKVHIKLDTGMARLGFSCRQEDFAQSVEWIRALSRCPNLDLEGIYTHFATADADDLSYLSLQSRRFQRMLAALAAEDIHFTLRHCANSAAIFLPEDLQYDMVRAGIVLYGGADGALMTRLDLRPVMTLKSRITLIHRLAAGESVGYGRSFTTTRPSRLAVMEIGYADGLARALSNQIKVSLRGKQVPLVGKICMDRCMLDVTDVSDAMIGDSVAIFGAGDGICPTADELAAMLGTIPYEIYTRISERVPRVLTSALTVQP